MTTKTKRGVIVLAWIAAIDVAAVCDRAVAVWVRQSGLEARMHAHKAVMETLKSPGLYWFTLLTAIVVALTHSLQWRAGGFLLLATVVSGINGLIKWMAGRVRPFKGDSLDSFGQRVATPFHLEPFNGGLAGLFHQRANLCFPSGHTALAFATAAALTILWPRSPWRWLGYAVAAVVAAERVAENAHWLSDTVAAAALGIGGAHLMHGIVTRLLPPAEKPLGSDVIAND